MTTLQLGYFIRRRRTEARKLLRDVQHRFIGLPWLRVQENDRFLFSWPRSGNTWLRHMIFFYFNDSDLRDHDALNAFIPTLDHLDFRDRLKQLEHEHWRFMKSHEPAAPYFLNGRVAYIVRDGRDATLSWYHYRKEVNGERTDFDTFLRRCLKGRTRYGSWAHNVGSWLEYRGHPALKVFRYEDILTDPAGVFEKILDHFGISADGTRIAYAVEQSSIDRVNRTFATLATSPGVGPFSGGSGGGTDKWQTAYTPAQKRLFLNHSGQVLRALGYED